MTRTGLLAGLVALLLAGSEPARAEWIEFKPKGEGFRVELPGRPGTAAVAGDKDIGSTHVVVSRFVQYSGSAYYVYFVRRDDFALGTLSGDPQKLFDLERDLFTKTSEAILVSEKRLMTGGAPARYLVLERSGSVTIDLMVAKGDRLIQVFCIVPSGFEKSETIERIYKSFALIEN